MVHNFEIMIANEGVMKCGGNCENGTLQTNDYLLRPNMFSFEIYGCDSILRVRQ